MLKGKLAEAKKLDSKRFEITDNLETKKCGTPDWNIEAA